jgi:GDP-L-fucose synthase
MAKKAILIVGAGGFVGSALARQLLRSENNVFLTARKKTTAFPKANMYYGDLADQSFCKKIVKDVDIAYYLAGYKKNIDIHTRHPFDAASGNILPLLNFLTAVKESGIKKIIYVSSTIIEYALRGDGQTDGYVLGKHINEILLRSFAAQTKIDVKIVRSAAVYGPGNDFNPLVSNLIPSLIVKTEKSKNDLFVWGKGKRKLQFIYIDDLVANLIAVSRSNESFFVIGNAEAITINDIVQKIIKFMDRKLKICHDLSKEDKPTKLSSFNNAVNPKVDLEAGLRKTIADYLTHYAQDINYRSELQ